MKEQKKRVALILGEDENDTRALRELINGLKPKLGAICQVRRQPTFLIKNVKPSDLPSRANAVRALVAAERVRHDVVCLFAHEDADAFPPFDSTLETQKRESLKSLGIPVHAVSPAWELEAWWFLWPEAAPAVARSWRAPDEYVGREVDRVQNAKEAFARATLPKGLNQRERATARRYQESDAPHLARKVVELGVLRSPKGKAKAWDRFQAAVEAQDP